MTTSAPSAGALVDAILTNSGSVVQQYLEAGFDPNTVVSPSNGGIPYLEDIRDPGDENDEISDQYELAIYRRPGQFPSLLHIAVVNCYHRIVKSSSSGREQALSILRCLMKHGADASATTPHLVVTHIRDYNWRLFDSADTTALGLAIFLKRFPLYAYEERTESLLNGAIEIIQDQKMTFQQPHTRILKSTADMLGKLYLSHDFSDICFVCSDGVEVPAHRNILAASSDYFKTSFEGPWAENSQDGKWTTTHSSKNVKAVLAFIYLGRIQNDVDGVEPLKLFSIASEYFIESLKTFAEGRCIQSLACDNCKEILQAAHLHNNDSLKKACFSFIHTNAAQVLTDPDMMKLATEDAELWAELTAGIAPSSGGGSKKKRARTS